MKLRVVRDLVFVRPDEKPDMTSDGLLHIVHENQRRTDTGVVVALGDGPVTSKGVKIPHYVSIGDRVVFSPDAGQQMDFEADQILVMSEEDILAVVEE